MSNRTILLIDYDPQSIEDAIKPLTGAGFTVEVANDGITGLQAFERLHPDLVLIEPMVPKKHGFEVCQEIKDSPHGRGIPVLITTGFYRGRKHHLEAKQFYGCDEYLEKPIAEDLLVSTCEKYFADDPDEPQLLEDLETIAPATSEVPGEGLPELEELSEEEIVARLDALIKEEPDPATEPPAAAEPEPPRETPDGDAVLFENEPTQLAETAAPVEEPVERKPAAEAEAAVVAEEGPVLLATPAAVTYGTPGAAADRSERLPRPKREIAAPDESSPPSRRLWIIAAAAALLVIAAGGIVLVPRLLRGDDAAQAAFAEPRPAVTAPAPARERVAEAPSEPLDATSATVETDVAEATGDEGPAAVPTSPARPAETASNRAERRAEPASRPEPKQATRTALPPPRPAPAEPQATPAAREDAPASSAATREPVAPPAEQNTAGDLVEPVQSLPAPSSSDAGPGSGPVEAATPLEDSVVDSAPPPQPGTAGALEEDAAAAAPGEAAPTPQEATLVSTPSRESGPAESAVSAAEEQAPVPRRRVARGTLLDISQVDTLPQPLNKQPPEYPPLARRLRLEGTITLRLLVNERGKVTDVETMTGDAQGVLAKAAERAAREWTYRPAMKDDVPVKVWIVERLVFQY